MKTIQTGYNDQDKFCRYSFTHILMLDNRFRKFFQNPEKILAEYITPGMTAIDLGCGPGTFTRAMAKLAGDEGTVIGCDIQDEMLGYAESRCKKTGPESRIIWQRGAPETPGIKKEADFILSFYMLHEVRNRDCFLREVFDILKPDGRYLITEPKFHVTEASFQKSIKSAEDAGFKIEKEQKTFFSRSVLLYKKNRD